MFEDFYTTHNETHMTNPFAVTSGTHNTFNPVSQLQNPLFNALAALMMAGIQTPSIPTANIEPVNVAIKGNYPEVEYFFSKLAEENPQRELLLHSV